MVALMLRHTFHPHPSLPPSRKERQGQNVGRESFPDMMSPKGSLRSAANGPPGTVAP